MALFYRTLGDGHPLIIIHGLYGASDNWMTIAKQLSSRFQVFAIDQRNHGQSPHLPQHDYFSMREDLKIFMDKHNLKKASILGHSMGGKTAIYFAAAYPERVEQLIVVDISPCAYTHDNSAKINIHRQIIGGLRAIDPAKLKTRSEADEILAQYISDKRTRQFLLKNLYRDNNKQFRWKLNLPVIEAQLKNVMDGFTPETINQKISGFPVLFIRGMKSDYLRPQDKEAALRLFPMAEFIDIPDAGHWVHAEQPRLFLKAVNQFLEG